ncbi:MAG: 6-pyruvoyl-tetrahydropterin synthase-related protein, partial [Chloroflexi bacterium]|nr:6-pyruvoyl-tetrahydropterin synthase-related protein [Chloroflexota bacterium]
MSPPKLARLDPFLPLALLLAGFAAYPLLNPGLPVTSDGLLQPYRLVELDAALRAGTLYPRWAPDLWLGYGYPLFNFYAPLFYYLGEAFRLLGFDFESSVKAVVVLSLLLASSSAYLLGRRLFGRLGGVVTAAAYIYTPHFLTEVFHRGDYPQLLGLALLPLVLWCTERLAAEGGRKWLAASALSLSALLLTHSVTALLFAPVFALWLLLLLAAARQQRALILARLVTANLLALGLSAFFWLPAVAERPLVQTQRLLTGHFDFRLHFQSMNALLSPVSPTDPQLLNAPVSFGLGLSQVALAGIAITGLACMIAGRAFTSPPSPRPSERVGSEAVHPHPDPLPGGEGYVGAHGRTPQNGEIVPHPNPLPEVAGLPEAVSEGRQTRLCDQLVSEATLASDSSGRGSPVAKGDSPRRGEGCVGAHGRAPLRDEEIALHPSPLAEKEGTGSPSPHTERSPKANRLSPEVARLAIFTNLRTRRLWRATRRGEDEGLGGEVIVPHPDPLPEGEGSRQHSPAERRGEHEDRAEIRRPILPQLWAIAVVALAVL